MSTTVRLTTLGASRRDQLDRIVEAGLVNQGRVFALSLEPVRLSLGDRWPHKKQQIWDAADRALEKRMPPPDVFLRIDDTTFLAAVASTDPYAAQVRCADALRSLLSFFLGRTADDDVVLTRVAALDGHGLVCEPVDLFAPPPAPGTSVTPTACPRSPEDWTPPLAGRRASLAVRTAGDEPGTVDLEIAPVWRLDQGVIGAYRINRSWRGDRRPTMAQAEVIDHLTTDFLLPVLEEYRREGGVFAVITPLDFGVVMPARPRLGLISRWSEASDVMRQVVILELEGVDAGVPAGRLGETAAMLAPFFHSVMLEVADQTVASGALREHAFSGVTIDAGRLRSRARLAALIGAARRYTKNIMLLNAPIWAGDEALRAGGISHTTRSEPDGDVQPVRRGASARV